MAILPNNLIPLTFRWDAVGGIGAWAADFIPIIGSPDLSQIRFPELGGFIPIAVSMSAKNTYTNDFYVSIVNTNSDLFVRAPSVFAEGADNSFSSTPADPINILRVCSITVPQNQTDWKFFELIDTESEGNYHTNAITSASYIRAVIKSVTPAPVPYGYDPIDPSFYAGLELTLWVTPWNAPTNSFDNGNYNSVSWDMVVYDPQYPVYLNSIGIDGLKLVGNSVGIRVKGIQVTVEKAPKAGNASFAILYYRRDANEPHGVYSNGEYASYNILHAPIRVYAGAPDNFSYIIPLDVAIPASGIEDFISFCFIRWGNSMDNAKGIHVKMFYEETAVAEFPYEGLYSLDLYVESVTFSGAATVIGIVNNSYDAEFVAMSFKANEVVGGTAEFQVKDSFGTGVDKLTAYAPLTSGDYKCLDVPSVSPVVDFVSLPLAKDTTLGIVLNPAISGVTVTDLSIRILLSRTN